MQLKKNVDDDYRKWKAGIVGGMNEAELINSFAGKIQNYFPYIAVFLEGDNMQIKLLSLLGASSSSASSTSNAATFLCVVFKLVCEGDRLTQTVPRVLERIGTFHLHRC